MNYRAHGLTGAEGFEPSLTVLETAILPLEDTPSHGTFLCYVKRIDLSSTIQSKLLEITTAVLPFIFSTSSSEQSLFCGFDLRVLFQQEFLQVILLRRLPVDNEPLTPVGSDHEIVRRIDKLSQDLIFISHPVL